MTRSAIHPGRYLNRSGQRRTVERVYEIAGRAVLDYSERSGHGTTTYMGGVSVDDFARWAVRRERT